MDRLVIPAEIFDEMLAHCKEGYPNEACGILAGNGSEVSRLYKLTNIERSPVSYLMDSGEQFRVMREMREKGLSMLAIFHSHPSSAPYPSQKDINLAFYDDAVYLIISLVGEEPDIKGFSIKGGTVKEIEVIVR